MPALGWKAHPRESDGVDGCAGRSAGGKRRERPSPGRRPPLRLWGRRGERHRLHRVRHRRLAADHRRRESRRLRIAAGQSPKNSPPCGPHRMDTSITRLLSIVRPRPTARQRPCLTGAFAVITRAIPDSGANRQIQIIPSRRAQASGLIFASRSQKRFGAAARKSSPRPVTPESGSTPALSSNGWAAALAPIAFK